MAAQEILSGVQIHRNGRYPYDYEQVHNSYTDLLDKLESDGEHGTKKGTLYAGLVTSVVDDENSIYNGPWYISYQKDENKISYHAARIPLMTDITSYIGDIGDKYVSHEQLNTTGACVDAAFVSSLGKDATLDIILSCLLTSAEYTKPTYSFNICDSTGSYIFGGVNGSTSNPVEVDSVYRLYAKINIDNFDGDINNHKGVSYGLGSAYCEIKYKDNYYQITELDESYRLSPSSSSPLYAYFFDTEGLHTISDDINFTYAQASYAYYPQLLNKGVYVYSKENWFDGGKFNINNYTIPAQYRYHYGWDDMNKNNKISAWLPIVKKDQQIVTSNIPFTSAHTAFWIAIPKDIVELDNTSNFQILYHTSIGDADLVSTSATVDNGEIENTEIFEGAPRTYIIKRIEFNKTINGAPGNYIKFTMKKIKE